MAYKSFYSGIDLRNIAKQRMGEELNRDLQLYRGQISPADLPSYRPAAEGIRTANERGLESLYGNLTQSGVTGPAAALSLERGKESGNDQITNLWNSLIGKTEAGFDKAASTRSSIQNMLAQAMAARKGQQGQSGFMKALPSIMSGVGAGIGTAVAPGAGTVAGANIGGNIGKTISGMEGGTGGSWEGGLPAGYGVDAGSEGQQTQLQKILYSMMKAMGYVGE